jgi:serine/threonine protein kinase
MAPEVIKQSGHGRSSDIWSVGATVIEMGTGKPPWPEFTNNLAALFHVATSKVPPPAPTHLSRNCASFLGRCMAIEPGERATAAHLLATDPFILSNSPHAQSLDSGGFNSPVDAVGVTRGAVTTSDEKCLATPRTDMLEKVKAAYENSIAVSQLLFPDDDIDEQLSVASSIAIDTPGKEDGGAMGQHGTRQAARK